MTSLGLINAIMAKIIAIDEAASCEVVIRTPDNHLIAVDGVVFHEERRQIVVHTVELDDSRR